MFPRYCKFDRQNSPVRVLAGRPTLSHLAESPRTRSAREAERPTLGAQRADRSWEPARRFTSAMSVRKADARFFIHFRSYDRSRIAPMGKRASAVPRLEKRFSPPSRRTFRFSLLRTHDPLHPLTGAGCALPLRSAGCGAHPTERRQRLRPLAGLAPKEPGKLWRLTYDRDYQHSA